MSQVGIYYLLIHYRDSKNLLNFHHEYIWITSLFFLLFHNQCINVIQDIDRPKIVKIGR